MAVPEIEVVTRTVAWRGSVGDAEALCRGAGAAAWRAAGAPPLAGPVAVALSDDAEVADLNRRYRDRDGPTNVLSFVYDRPPAAEPDAPIGDIIVAYETADAEARAEARPLADHLGRLVVHGMLHVLGYDHQTPVEAAEMEALEAEALAAIGADDPEAPLLTRTDDPTDCR